LGRTAHITHADFIRLQHVESRSQERPDVVCGRFRPGMGGASQTRGTKTADRLMQPFESSKIVTVRPSTRKQAAVLFHHQRRTTKAGASEHRLRSDDGRTKAARTDETFTQQREEHDVLLGGLHARVTSLRLLSISCGQLAFSSEWPIRRQPRLRVMFALAPPHSHARHWRAAKTGASRFDTVASIAPLRPWLIKWGECCRACFHSKHFSLHVRD